MYSKPTFTKSDEENRHFKLLKEVVTERLSEKTQPHLWHRIKCFVLPFAYIAFWYLAMVFKSQPALYYVFFSLIGITTTLIFVNLIHEACHFQLFKKKWHNKMMIYFFDCMGANSFIWSIRHIRLHHNYPNTVGWDCDIEQGGPIKIFPSKKQSYMQRFQHYYMFILYPFFFFNWVFVRDFRDFYSSERYVRKVCVIPAIEHLKLWIFKLFFISFTILIPVFAFHIPFLQAFSGLVFLMFSGSLVGMIILLTPHANTGNEFPVPDENSSLESSWFRQQFVTTNDVKGDLFFSKYLMNNFNFHLAHHLFPHLSAWQTAAATDIIREFAAEHHLPYKSYTLFEAFRLHYQLIRKNAIMPQSIFEEDM
jgi:linoleoyl-CoA desaturase